MYGFDRETNSIAFTDSILPRSASYAVDENGVLKSVAKIALVGRFSSQLVRIWLIDYPLGCNHSQRARTRSFKAVFVAPMLEPSLDFNSLISND